MKTKNGLWYILMLVCSVVFTACDDDDDNGLKTQPHDDNEMMAITHDMSADMDAMTMTKDADHDFAMMMKMHHEQALDMAKVELAHGKSAELKAMATKIISGQKKEIAQFDRWLAKHK